MPSKTLVLPVQTITIHAVNLEHSQRTLANDTSLQYWEGGRLSYGCVVTIYKFLSLVT